MLTLKEPARFEETIRKSRFVVHAAPVTTQRASLAFYESVMDPGATHNCWAWRIDFQVRSSDDGEPSGTAGRPILNAIERHHLENVMIVVTRYFGGIKLGAGGLVRAYGGTASKCLDRAVIRELFPMTECTVKAGFEWAASIHEALRQFGAKKLDETYGDEGLTLRFRCRERDFGKLSASLRDSSRGQIRCFRD